MNVSIKQRKRIALDVDDVLAEFYPHACRYYGKQHIKTHYWCADTIQQLFGVEDWFTPIAQNKDFWATQPVLNGPGELTFEFDCYLSAFPPEVYEVRRDWLQRNGFPDKPLILAHDKLAACIEHDIDLLVDDKPLTAQIFQEEQWAGKQCLHYLGPYAGFEPVGDYITSLKQVNNFL